MDIDYNDRSAYYATMFIVGGVLFMIGMLCGNVSSQRRIYSLQFLADDGWYYYCSLGSGPIKFIHRDHAETMAMHLSTAILRLPKDPDQWRLLDQYGNKYDCTLWLSLATQAARSEHG